MTDVHDPSAQPADEAVAAPDAPDETEAVDAVLPVGGFTPDAAEAADETDAAGENPDASTGDAADAVEVLDEDALLETDTTARAPSPYDLPGRWFVVHTQSGYEKKVKQNLEARIASMGMEGRIHEVVIPTHEVPEFKNGKKVITEKKLFPGYLLVRCALDDDAWYVIRNTPGVTGFVNQGGKPTPLRRRDVEKFLGTGAEEAAETVKKAKPLFAFDVGETVRVKEGPFADFSGEIIEINEDQLKVKVLVDIFGRETPVELEFSQVARL
ncbi:MAG: transcription termination/antitermination protein NusG [Actinomyces sp.]|nr:MAG: transcription termination/antitermination protein NusG [Actinomyces sp.]